MKLLIVDDEKIIRRGIVNCFCWSDFGIADVYEAKNGKEALAVFRQYKPNIVLTDIRMPLMDGLAFAEEIRRESAATQIIYITGFSDVDYLRAAVKNAAVDYIMKPVDPQELKAAVNKAVKNCQNTQRAQRRYLALEQLALQSRPLLTRQLLLSLLHANYPSKEAVAQKAKLLGLPFDLESTFIVAVISVQRGKVVSQKYDDDLFSAGFENVAAEILGQQAPGFIFSCGNLEFAAVVSAGEIAAPQLQGLFKKLQGAVRHYLGAEAFVVIGPEVEGLFSLQESYAHARTGLKQQFRFSPGALVSYEDCSAVSQGSCEIKGVQISEIVRQIHSGNLFAAQAGAADIIGNAAAHMNSSEDLYGFCLLLFSWILLEEQRQTLSQEEIRIFLQLAESLSACHLTEALQAGVNQALDGFSAAVAQGFIPRRSQLVHEIKTYIRGHLEESPTIKEVAAQVFLAPTYVCTLFKEETGKTINAFMVEEKMAKAQILFRGGALRVYQVSKMLGYQDVKYFSRTFKRFTGLTPSAYIEKASERP